MNEITIGNTRLIHGNVLEVLKVIPSESVDLIVTSPPYYALRKYPDETEIEWEDGIKCQLGLEPTPELYVEHLGLILKELYRVLKPTGVFFLNIGDSYSGDMGKRKGWSYVKGLENKKDGTAINVSAGYDLPKKCLLCIPERVLFKCLEIGFIVRNKIIWRKPNALPSSAKDRFTTTWEYIYMLVKKPKGYYFNLDAVREPYCQATIERAMRFIKNQEHFDPSKHKHGEFLGQNPYEVLENFVKSLVRDAKEGRLEAKWGDMYKASEEEIKKYVEGIDSKFLKNPDVETGSLGGRVLRNLAEGKLTTKVLKRVQDVNAYLKQKLKEKGLTVKQLAEMTGMKESTIAHYFRTDLSGMAIPPKDFWEVVKPILDLDEYEKFVTEEIKSIFPYPNILGKNPGDVWDITTEQFREAHFSVFPKKLVARCIASACPPDGVVLDPFIGSGTTALVCELFNTKQFDKISKIETVVNLDVIKKIDWNIKCIGIDIVKDYIQMAYNRIKNEVYYGTKTLEVF